jgi:hypothetical protein
VTTWVIPSERCPNRYVKGFHRARSAYTLLEVILALALTTVLLGLIGMAMHIHLGVADKSRGQVEEARLARTLLQHIADDLRNSVPFTPTSSSGTSSGGTSTASATSATSGLSSGSGSSTTADSSDSGTVTPAGICGTAQCLQMDTTRRVRPTGMTKPSNNADNSMVMLLADVKTVTYSLGDPGTASPTEGGNSSNGQTGLYRREVDRPAYVSAMQQGQTDILTQATSQLAPEVVNVQFTYYDSTTTYDQWDSNTQGSLPVAIKVAIMLRRAVAKSPNAAVLGSADNSALAVYDMLVDLPNSQVQPSQSTGQGAGASSAGTATQTNGPTPGVSPGREGGYRRGGNAQPGEEGQPGNRGGRNRGGGNRGGGNRGGGNRGGGERGGGNRGAGERGAGERGAGGRGAGEGGAGSRGQGK